MEEDDETEEELVPVESEEPLDGFSSCDWEEFDWIEKLDNSDSSDWLDQLDVEDWDESEGGLEISDWLEASDSHE